MKPAGFLLLSILFALGPAPAVAQEADTKKADKADEDMPPREHIFWLGGYGSPVEGGLKMSRIHKSSLVHKMGLKDGDLITHISCTPKGKDPKWHETLDHKKIMDYIMKRQAGEILRLRYVRDGKQMTGDMVMVDPMTLALKRMMSPDMMGGQKTLKEKKKTEKESRNSHAGALFEDVFQDIREQKVDDAILALGELLDRYPYATYEKVWVPKKVLDIVREQGDEFMESWKRVFTLDVQKSLEQGVSGPAILVKGFNSGHLETLWGRLRATLYEEGRIADLALAVRFGELFELDTTGLRRDLKKSLRAGGDPALSAWVLKTFDKKLLDPDLEQVLQARRDARSGRRLEASVLPSGIPAPGMLWCAGTPSEPKRDTRFNGLRTPFLARPSLVDGVVRTLKVVDGGAELASHGADDGGLLWSRDFAAPKGLKPVAHYSAAGAGGFFDAVCWSKSPTGFNRPTDLTFHDRDGSLIWSRRLGQDEEGAVLSAAGDPWLAPGIVLLPVYDATGTTNMGGTLDLALRGFDAVTGKVLFTLQVVTVEILMAVADAPLHGVMNGSVLTILTPFNRAVAVDWRQRRVLWEVDITEEGFEDKRGTGSSPLIRSFRKVIRSSKHGHRVSFGDGFLVRSGGVLFMRSDYDHRSFLVDAATGRHLKTLRFPDARLLGTGDDSVTLALPTALATVRGISSGNPTVDSVPADLPLDMSQLTGWSGGALAVSEGRISFIESTGKRHDWGPVRSPGILSTYGDAVLVNGPAHVGRLRLIDGGVEALRRAWTEHRDDPHWLRMMLSIGEVDRNHAANLLETAAPEAFDEGSVAEFIGSLVRLGEQSTDGLKTLADRLAEASDIRSARGFAAILAGKDDADFTLKMGDTTLTGRGLKRWAQGRGLGTLPPSWADETITTLRRWHLSRRRELTGQLIPEAPFTGELRGGVWVDVAGKSWSGVDGKIRGRYTGRILDAGVDYILLQEEGRLSCRRSVGGVLQDVAWSVEHKIDSKPNPLEVIPGRRGPRRPRVPAVSVHTIGPVVLIHRGSELSARDAVDGRLLWTRPVGGGVKVGKLDRAGKGLLIPMVSVMGSAAPVVQKIHMATGRTLDRHVSKFGSLSMTTNKVQTFRSDRGILFARADEWSLVGPKGESLRVEVSTALDPAEHQVTRVLECHGTRTIARSKAGGLLVFDEDFNRTVVLGHKGRYAVGGDTLCYVDEARGFVSVNMDSGKASEPVDLGGGTCLDIAVIGSDAYVLIQKDKETPVRLIHLDLEGGEPKTLNADDDHGYSEIVDGGGFLLIRGAPSLILRYGE